MSFIKRSHQFECNVEPLPWGQATVVLDVRLVGFGESIEELNLPPYFVTHVDSLADSRNQGQAKG